MTTFGIDFDDTYTSDPELFALFVEAAIMRGHRCVIVTQRASCFEPDLRQVVGAGLEIIYCAGMTKAEGCAAAGVQVDVWMDDYPDAINHVARAYAGIV